MSNILVSVANTLNETPESKGFYKSILESISQSIVVTDDSGKIKFTTKTFRDLFGYDQEEIIDLTWANYVHADDQMYYKKVSGHIATHPHKRVRIEYRIKDYNGSWRWISGYASNEISSPDIKGVVFSFNDVSKERETGKALLQIGHYSQHSGLVNQSLFYDRLKYALSYASRHEQKLGLIFIDIDMRQTTIPSIDATTNAALLREVGDRVLSCLRQTDTVSSWEHDKFAVIFTDIHTIQNVITVLSKIMKKISRPIYIGSNKIVIQPAMGVALYPDDVVDAENLVIYTDMALQVAKLQGGNRFYFYNDQVHALYEEQIFHHSLRN